MAQTLVGLVHAVGPEFLPEPWPRLGPSVEHFQSAVLQFDVLMLVGSSKAHNLLKRACALCGK